MGKREERVQVRLTAAELEHLKKCSREQGGRFVRSGRVNFSDYLRLLLLSGSGYRDEALVRQLRGLKYELRKIGTNVNQVAKKVNSGFGTPQDIERLSGYLARIEQAFEGLGQDIGARYAEGNGLRDGADGNGKE